MLMNHTKRFLYQLIYIVALPLLAGCLSIDYTPIAQQAFFQKTEQALRVLDRKTQASPHPGPFQVGTAKIEITPPVGLPMAAYGARTSVGIHDPIFARAIAISSGTVTVVLVSIDLLAVTDDLARSVFKKVQAAVPLPEEDLLIAATHTHSGPGSIGKRFWETLAAGPYNDAVFEMTADGTARAAIEAYRRLQAATVTYGRTNAGDLILNRMIAGGPTDPELSFLIFKNREGRPIAYLINFSAHPTLLRSTNRLLSGDFPGVVSRVLEESEGRKDVVALYTSGAVADQRTRPPKGNNVFERADRMGHELAERILAEDAHWPSQDLVEVMSDKIPLELPAPQIKVNPARRLPIWMGRALLDGATSVQVVRIGRTLLLAVPCDLGSQIGLALKRYARARGMEAIVVGFANDYIGYVISEEYYATPAYEAFMSFNGPHMGDYMSFAMEKLIDRLKPDQDASDR
jgi:Neutral/alkaline non-lysosomal ceramidase, N-terminal